MTEIALKCSCGTVQGSAKDIAPNLGTRIICYCEDCQAFANYLSKTDKIVDGQGGIDIFQLPPSTITINEGIEQLRCIRLSPKGMFRWYTECCQTPIGNTLASGGSFVGLIHSFIGEANSRESKLGPIKAYIHTKSAKEPLPIHVKEAGAPVSVMLGMMFKLIKWKLKGLNKPSPFFSANGNPISSPQIINKTREK